MLFKNGGDSGQEGQELTCPYCGNDQSFHRKLRKGDRLKCGFCNTLYIYDLGKFRKMRKSDYTW